MPGQQRGGAPHPTEPVLRLDLYAGEEVLAAPEPRLVRQAGVAFSRPTIHPYAPAS